MLSIRLSRVGKKKAPVYRIVVMPKHRDPWANNTEILGHYNPRKTPKELVIDTDRVKHWLDKGAQATDTVWNLLVSEKIIEGEKRGVSTLSKKRKVRTEKKEAVKIEKAEAIKVKAEAAAKAEAVKAVEVETAKAEEVKEPEAPVEEKGSKEEMVEEKIEEAKDEEVKDESPAEVAEEVKAESVE